MIGHIGAALSHPPSVSPSQPTQAHKPDPTAEAAQPSSQTPTSAAASQVVQAVPDSDTGRGADLQPQLNQQPQQQGTKGINKEALTILKDVQTTAPTEDFRTELAAQLQAAGQDSTQPIVDIRI